ncbi:MAG: hypothetical protein EBE86_018130 [Hormoscilla sp. GUM202]|nr:hypothetical protein [Hormoscilla sp. GUM202]
MHEETGFVEKLGFWASIAGNSTFRSPQPGSKAGMDPDHFGRIQNDLQLQASHNDVGALREDYAKNP